MIKVYFAFQWKTLYYSRARETRASEAPWVSKSTNPRKFGNHTDRPPTVRPLHMHAYQCKITQSTGMTTQMQLEVILAGNRIATRVITKE